jgi:hypothetical protein
MQKFQLSTYFITLYKFLKLAMKRSMLQLIIAICAILFFIGCRFEDGPLISFKSVYDRMEGSWKLTHYLVDDVDSINELNNLFDGECVMDFPTDWTPKCDCGIPTWSIQWGDT